MSNLFYINDYFNDNNTGNWQLHVAIRFMSMSSWIFFHSLTRPAYLYNGCLALYNVVLISRVHSSVKYRQHSTLNFFSLTVTVETL